MEIDDDIRLCFHNVLNEVCNGIEIEDFVSVIGADREQVKALLQRLDERMGHPRRGMLLDEAEVRVISNALARTLDELGPEEFPIRVGVSTAKAKEILESLRAQ